MKKQMPYATSSWRQASQNCDWLRMKGYPNAQPFDHPTHFSKRTILLGFDPHKGNAPVYVAADIDTPVYHDGVLANYPPYGGFTSGPFAKK